MGAAEEEVVEDPEVVAVHAGLAGVAMWEIGTEDSTVLVAVPVTA